jgi:hypothetical protein
VTVRHVVCRRRFRGPAVPRSVDEVDRRGGVEDARVRARTDRDTADVVAPQAGRGAEGGAWTASSTVIPCCGRRARHRADRGGVARHPVTGRGGGHASNTEEATRSDPGVIGSSAPYASDVVDRAVDRTEEFRQNEEHPAERMATEQPHRCSTGANHNPRVGGSSPSSGIAWQSGKQRL